MTSSSGAASAIPRKDQETWEDLELSVSADYLQIEKSGQPTQQQGRSQYEENRCTCLSHCFVFF